MDNGADDTQALRNPDAELNRLRAWSNSLIQLVPDDFEMPLPPLPADGSRPSPITQEQIVSAWVLSLLNHTPTQWAYDQACKALAHHRQIADEATAALVRSSLDFDEAEELRRRFETPLAATP